MEMVKKCMHLLKEKFRHEVVGEKEQLRRNVVLILFSPAALYFFLLAQKKVTKKRAPSGKMLRMPKG